VVTAPAGDFMLPPPRIGRSGIATHPFRLDPSTKKDYHGPMSGVDKSASHVASVIEITTGTPPESSLQVDGPLRWYHGGRTGRSGRSEKCRDMCRCSIPGSTRAAPPGRREAQRPIRSVATTKAAKARESGAGTATSAVMIWNAPMLSVLATS
jgi:hypothetical protein